MNIQAEKLELIERIIQLENQEILQQIKEMLTEPSIDWWDQITDQEQKAIEAGITQAGQEEGISHQEALQHIMAQRKK